MAEEHGFGDGGFAGDPDYSARPPVSIRPVIGRFLEESGGHVVLDADLKVVYAGPEFLRLTKGKRADVTGKYFIDNITDPNPQRQAQVIGMLRASFHRAIQTGEPDKLPIFRCDVFESGSKHPEERWWKAATIPVIDEGGIKLLVHRIEDVTPVTITSRAISAQRRSNYVLYTLAILLSGIIAYTSNHNSQRFNKVDIKTCEVQSQYLKSTHPLADAMSDVNRLLQEPPIPGQPRQPRAERHILSSLEKHLAIYLAITSKLPRGRKCPSDNG